MTLRIEDTDNDAFGETDESRAAEIARILSDVAELIMQGHEGGKCFDVNGNAVGKWNL